MGNSSNPHEPPADRRNTKQPVKDNVRSSREVYCKAQVPRHSLTLERQKNRGLFFIFGTWARSSRVEEEEVVALES